MPRPLARFCAHLREAGVDCQLLPAPGPAGPEQAVLRLPREDPSGRWPQLELQLMLLPGVTEPRVLQLFMPLDRACPLRPEAVPELSRVLHALNAVLPLTGFVLVERAGLVCFRCLLALPSGDPLQADLDEDLVVHTTAMVANLVERFAPIVAAVASGGRTCDQALAEAGGP